MTVTIPLRVAAAATVIGATMLIAAAPASSETVTLPELPVPHISIAGAPLITTGDGTGAPGPGVDAMAPISGTADLDVDTPTPPDVAPDVPVTVPGEDVPNAPARHALSVHASADACVALAVLTGHAPRGCRVPEGKSPSVADALARLGTCVRLATAAGLPTTACGTPTTADAPFVSSLLANSATNPAICLALEQLDALGAGPCTALSSVASSSTDSTTSDGNSTSSRNDMCLGVAAITSSDPARCTNPDADAPVGATDRDPTGDQDESVRAPSLVGELGGPGFPGAVGSAGDASAAGMQHAANSTGALPFTGGAIGTTAMVGVLCIAAGGIARLLRRTSTG
jgi:hypothetical protein